MDRKLLEKQVAEKTKGKMIDEKYMDMLMSNSSVEIVPLVLPLKRTKFLSISMYVDDQGIAKNLPKNERACQISFAAGRPMEVRGDAFFGRVYDDQDDWGRRDFTMKDCSSDAEWLLSAKEANKEGQASNTASTMNLKNMLMQQQAQAAAQAAGREKKKLPEGSNEKYKWTQSEDEVEITVPVHPGCSGKDVVVKMKSKTISVEVKGEVVLEGSLSNVIHTDGSTWSLSGDGGERAVSVVLEKAREVTWSSLLKDSS